MGFNFNICIYWSQSDNETNSPEQMEEIICETWDILDRWDNKEKCLCVC